MPKYRRTKCIELFNSSQVSANEWMLFKKWIFREWNFWLQPMQNIHECLHGGFFAILCLPTKAQKCPFQSDLSSYCVFDQKCQIIKSRLWKDYGSLWKRGQFFIHALWWSWQCELQPRWIGHIKIPFSDLPNYSAFGQRSDLTLNGRFGFLLVFKRDHSRRIAFMGIWLDSRRVAAFCRPF